MGRPAIDMTGLRIGKLTVLRRATHENTDDARWLCRCDCGIEKAIGRSALARGQQSCGCILIERGKETATVHGMSYTRTYRICRGLRNRCNDPKDASYKWYGALGISYDPRWNDFQNFLADMGECPTPKHTIDRKDSTGNYCKENCRWRTMKEQQNNRKDNILLTFKDRTQTMSQWSEELGYQPSTIGNRLKRGWSVEEALSIPPLRRGPVRLT